MLMVPINTRTGINSCSQSLQHLSADFQNVHEDPVCGAFPARCVSMHSVLCSSLSDREESSLLSRRHTEGPQQ
ncbi:hypothetical protein XENORESO_004774 [Xenotaenia resolanae]|uniref:Uncharacterized protein n=1 Tax=Xenotaenia resolanae TaxID=208358 RepID=A0ABV0VLF8_9TELE